MLIMTKSSINSSRLMSQVTQPKDTQFDLSIEQDVLALLRHVHQLPLDNDIKNELRDRIFAFRQTETRTDFKALAKLASSARIKLCSSEHSYGYELEEKKTANRFGSSRPVPTFSLDEYKIIPKDKPSKNTDSELNKVTTDQETADTVTNEETVEEMVNSESLDDTEEPANQPIENTVHTEEEPDHSTPTNEPVAQDDKAKIDVPNYDNKQDQVLQANQEESAQPISTPASLSPDTYSARVVEIKHAVNELVGNPITLLEVDNTVGKEYLNALLDAMKKQNGGRLDEMTTALTRLETAFEAVKVAVNNKPPSNPVDNIQADNTYQEAEQNRIEEHQTFTPSSATEENSEPQSNIQQSDNYNVPPYKETPDQVMKPINNPPEFEQMASANTYNPTQTRQTSEETKNTDAFNETETHFSSDKQTLPPPPSFSNTPTPTGYGNHSGTPKQKINDSFDNLPPQPHSPTQNTFDPVKPVSEEIDVAPKAHTETTPIPPQVPPQENNKQIPVSNDDPLDVPEPLSSPAVLPVVRDKRVHESRQSEFIRQSQENISQEPLLSPDVNAGLSQLLSEWKLFKSSGIFGTGPNGYDHPLFKKLADLPMHSVVAGRFEGVTPEIRRSLSDYMNGWRYEIGIMYEPGENFERYLRRVVHRILDTRGKKQI